MRRTVAKWLRRLARRVDKAPEVTPYPVVDEAGREQAKAMKDIARQIKGNTAAIRNAQMERAFTRDRAEMSSATSDPLAPGMPVRIESDGTPNETRVFVGEVPISNAVRTTWQISVGGLARALVEFDQVAANVTGEMVDHG